MLTAYKKWEVKFTLCLGFTSILTTMTSPISTLIKSIWLEKIFADVIFNIAENRPIHVDNCLLTWKIVNFMGCCSNFIESESFLEWNHCDILAVCKTDLDDSIDSGNFHVRGYLPLFRKDFVTPMHSLAVYVKEGLPFAHDLSLKNSSDSYVFDWLFFIHCLTCFSSINHLLQLYAWFLMLFHLIDEVLSISPSCLLRL